MTDLIFTAGSVCFALALLPMVFGSVKPARASAALTAFWLWVFAANYVTLNLTFSAITTGITAALWTVLLVQSTRDRSST